MTDREKVQKAFNQCSDALSNLDQKGIMKVFHLLSVQYDIVPPPVDNSGQTVQTDNYYQSNNNLLESGNVDVIEVEKTNQKKQPIKSSKINKSKGSNVKISTMLANLNLRPPNAKHLITFFSEFKIKSDYEANLIFTYYLKTFLKEDMISVDHIYTCYKEVKRKIPTNLYQSIANTKRDKSWLDTSNTSDLKLTVQGENYIEHDIIKIEKN